MGFIKFITQDFDNNKNNTKGKIAVFCFRIANYCKGKKATKIILLPYLFFYKFFFEWLIGMEIPYNVSIGPGLKILHLQAIVINRNAIVGANCQLRQCVTIGNKGDGGPSPVIGDNVNIGAQVCIIGDIIIGNNVNIGAGSVVVKSVTSDVTIVGNPARILGI